VQALLVLNAGSSSIKFALHDRANGTSLFRGQVERIGHGPTLRIGGQVQRLDLAAAEGHDAVLDWLMDNLSDISRIAPPVAAAHRVVHGGSDFDGPVAIDAGALERIRALAPLAPAHQPHNIAGIEAVTRRYPGLRQVACFDTAFHRTQPRLEQLYALPRDLTAAGVLRYGFHGLSYEYIASRLPHVLGPRGDRRVAVLHLGNGASICGMQNRRSVMTSMGFTALDGLMMGKRCGDLDPGVIFYLARERGLSIDEIEALVGERSGLLGVSGISSDMRDLLASDRPEAAEAVDLFVLTALKQLGAAAAAMGGLDAMVFTGGIGEHAAPVRAGIVNGMTWLGAALDAEANAAHKTLISPSGTVLPAYVIPTDEEACIAGQALGILAGFEI